MEFSCLSSAIRYFDSWQTQSRAILPQALNSKINSVLDADKVLQSYPKKISSNLQVVFLLGYRFSTSTQDRSTDLFVIDLLTLQTLSRINIIQGNYLQLCSHFEESGDRNDNFLRIACVQNISQSEQQILLIQIELNNFDVTTLKIPVKNEIIKMNLAISLMLTSEKLTEIVIYEQLIGDTPPQLQLLYFVDPDGLSVLEISIPVDAGLQQFHSISRLSSSPVSSVVLSGMETDQKSASAKLAFR